MLRKTALITGASGGIGSAIAKAFASSGYDLVLTCHENRDKLDNLCKELSKKYSVNISAYTVDLTDPEDIDSLFNDLTDLDVLVNNAGIAYIGLLSEMPINEWHRVIDTNLTSVYMCCRHAIPMMLQKHSGRIINISSVWGVCGASMEVAYSASKGGVNALTQALAKELAPSNISVNAIACGTIDTTMNDHLTPEEKMDLVAQIPADRMGAPDEVAHLAVQLAESPDYLTGQIIRLDGGWI